MAENVITKTGSTKKDSYQKYLANIALYSIGLDSINANLNREAFWDAHKESEPSITNYVSSRYQVSDFDEDHFDMEASLLFQMRDTSGNAFLTIEMTYFAHFHPKSGKFDRKLSEQFAQGEARLIFWPYFRQATSDMSARMHIPPVTLPLSV